MSPERLSAQDATLWSVQPDEAPLQFGGVAILEGAALRDSTGAVRVDAIRARIGSKLHRVPRFRQRLRAVPFGQGLIFVDDPRFDLDDHVRVGRIDEPGCDESLRRFVARLLEVPLDPDRPLWEIWILDGLADGRVAVVPKVSHVLADGMAILDFALSLFDGVTEGDGRSRPWSAEPVPGDLSLVVDGVVDRARRQAGALWRIGRTILQPGHLLQVVTSLTRFGTGGAGRAPGLSITAPVGGRRDVAWLRLPWDDLDRVKRAEGVTLNDVVLSVVAGALAHYLDRTSSTPARPPRALVPVSTHGRVPGEEIENRFSMMVAALPTMSRDPLERLRAVHAEMEEHKRSGQASIGPLLFAVGDLVPFCVLRAVGPVLLRHQPVVNVAVTDLPGTREPLHLLGARLLELYPYVGVTGNLAVIIGIISYGDSLGVGVTVDADVVPDIDVLVDGLVRSADELVAAADATARSTSASRTPGTGRVG